ncbi:MAG: 2Fe-2S iron-sulfur cluster-binding protein [Gammaproteobacteria bacterium]
MAAAESDFHNLTVSSIKADTENARVVSFDIPDNLKPAFEFRAGQYITLEHVIDGHSVRRSYSICSAPGDPKLQIGVKRVEGGVFSTFVNTALQAGDVVKVLPPRGNFFTPLDPQQSKNYLFIAAGSGITPVLSLIKTSLSVEPNSRATLIYGNQSTATMMFKNELSFVKNRFMSRLHWINIYSRQPQPAPLLNGRIDNKKGGELNKSLIDLAGFDDFFLCGPESMISEVSRGLTAFGIGNDRIHYELFATSAEDAKRIIAKHHARAVKFKGKTSRIELIKGGREYHFELSRDGENLLDAGISQGADLPFSCKAGICATCKCKLVSGEVEMDIDHGLQESEVREGYILGCQAHPVSDTVRVDFDQY